MPENGPVFPLFRMSRFPPRFRIVSLCAVVFALIACASPASAPSPTPTIEPETLRLAFASSDLAVGNNRVVFGVLDDAEGPVRDAEVVVSTFFLTPTGGQEGPVETVDAVFRAWPVTPRGVFTAELNFDRPGEWGIGAVVTDGDGAERKASARVRVKNAPATPAIGAAAPRSVSKTLADVDGLEQITTDFEPNADLYGITIVDALDTGMPLMVVFSTPAYCQTATCGPQVSDLSVLADRYEDQASFVHGEVYRDPHRINPADPARELVPAVDEWGLVSEPWTFVVGSDGRIADRFEQYVPPQVLEAALLAAINR